MGCIYIQVQVIATRQRACAYTSHHSHIHTEAEAAMNQGNYHSPQHAHTAGHLEQFGIKCLAQKHIVMLMQRLGIKPSTFQSVDSHIHPELHILYFVVIICADFSLALT